MQALVNVVTLHSVFRVWGYRGKVFAKGECGGESGTRLLVSQGDGKAISTPNTMAQK